MAGKFFDNGEANMSTYVMSDIHGCYDVFLSMLETICFSDADCLIVAGDCIDRGTQSYEMLQWIERRPSNAQLLRGNHEEEFVAYVDLMLLLDHREELGTDFSSNVDTAALYESMKYFMRHSRLPVSCFDLYGTIDCLLKQNHVTLSDLCRWSAAIRQMPYYRKLHIRGRTYIVVHAGYLESLENVGGHFDSCEQFYLYAREETFQFGGVRHGTVIAGHTPTIAKESFAYNKGEVFCYFDDTKDCVFYDIDCGCAFRDREPEARLACIRLEDEKIFYV